MYQNKQGIQTISDNHDRKVGLQQSEDNPIPIMPLTFF
jgi:hypothetical protein